MKNLEDAIADYLYLNSETGSPAPTMDDCKYDIDDELANLKFLANKLSSLPFSFCDGSLLHAAVTDAIDGIDWNVVLEKINFLRMKEN
jgi:hypothetical protein